MKQCWKTYRLGEIGKIVTGKTPRTSQSEYFDGDIPFITPADLNTPFKRILSTQRTLTIEGLNSIKGCIIPANSIAVSCIGNLGYVGITNQICATNQQINTIIVNDQFDSHFIYYTIKHLWPYFKNLEGQSTTLSILNKTQFSQIEISLPSLEEQRRIAGILGAIDDKIENNRRINTNLELQAQALYKQWFVDFEFPNEEGKPYKSSGGKMEDSELGLIPEGWRVQRLDDYTVIKRGGSPRPIQNYLSNTGLNWLKISDATSTTSPFILEIKEFIKEEGLSKTVFLKKGNLVLSNSATPCIPKFLGLDTCIHDGWLYFPNAKLSKEYLYLLFKNNRQEILSQGNGSVFLNLKTDILKSHLICLPNCIEKMNCFNMIVKAIFKNIENCSFEIKRLATLRDTLLPKLMNGEIKV